MFEDTCKIISQDPNDLSETVWVHQIVKELSQKAKQVYRKQIHHSIGTTPVQDLIRRGAK